MNAMNKLKQRAAMKRLAIQKVKNDLEAFSSTTPWYISIPKMMSIAAKGKGIQRTPSKYFCHDKPKLDKRRIKNATSSI